MGTKVSKYQSDVIGYGYFISCCSEFSTTSNSQAEHENLSRLRIGCPPKSFRNMVML